eukprot:4755179-Prymnesium_polylepis.1
MQRCSTGAMFATGARGGRKRPNRTYGRGSSSCGERTCRGESSRPHQWMCGERGGGTRNDPALARRACPAARPTAATR